MLFNAIPGYTLVKERLKGQVTHGRISHAQLFIGSEGTAALALALAYAQYVLCKHRTNGEACGVCASCNKMQKLIHPDVHFVFPTNTTKTVKKQPHSDALLTQWREALLAQVYQTEMQWYEYIGVENGQGNIPTLDAEKLISKLAYKAYEGDYKIAIIWMAERMNVEASNKLLKLLEEPPEGTLLLLISVDPRKLLKTIRSRVQELVIPFEPVLPANAELSALQEEALQWLRLCIQRQPQDTIDLVGFVENVSGRSRESIKYLLRVLLEEIRKILVQHQLRQTAMEEPTDSGRADSDQRSDSESAKYAPFVHVQNIAEIYSEINTAYAQIAQNGSARIVLLDMAFQLRKLLIKMT